MQFRNGTVLAEEDQPDPLGQPRAAQPSLQRFSALITFDNCEYGVEDLQVAGITIILPSAGAGQAEDIEAVEQEGMCIALTLH